MNKNMKIGIVALVAIIVVVAAVLLMSNPSKPEPPAGPKAYISNFAYLPANLTVHVGDTVTWTNNDTVLHTVTSNETTGPEVFNSGSMAQGSHFSHTFTTIGEYEYHCIPHPYMVGKVIVVA